MQQTKKFQLVAETTHSGFAQFFREGGRSRALVLPPKTWGVTATAQTAHTSPQFALAEGDLEGVNPQSTEFDTHC